MAKNFFRNMVSIEDYLIKNHIKNEKFVVLNMLIDFIVEGSFTNSVVEKFICKNFRKSSDELTLLWNENERTRKKSKNTFRSQVSTLSSKLYLFFDINEDDMNSMFLHSDVCESKFEVLRDFLSLRYLDDKPSDFRFSYSLYEYLEGYDYEDEYSLEDCKKELEVLRFLDYHHLNSLLSACDKDKLAFLYSRMRAPLIMETEMGNRVGMELNLSKLNFYKGYVGIRPRKSFLNGLLDSTLVVDTKAVDSDTEEVVTDVEDITSDTTAGDSSDKKVDSDTTVWDSDTVAGESDTIAGDSDSTRVNIDTITQVQEVEGVGTDTKDVDFSIKDVNSDTTEICSDTVQPTQGAILCINSIPIRNEKFRAIAKNYIDNSRSLVDYNQDRVSEYMRVMMLATTEEELLDVIMRHKDSWYHPDFGVALRLLS